jgi:hypothetical protein
MNIRTLTIDQYFEIDGQGLREQINIWALNQEIDLPANLFEHEFETILQLREITADNDKDLLTAYANVLGIEPIYWLAYRATIHFIEKLNELNLDEAKKFEGNITTDEDNAAGIDELNIFGAWNILDRVAQRYSILPEQVLKMKYLEVITPIHKDFIEAKINKRRYENANRELSSKPK